MQLVELAWDETSNLIFEFEKDKQEENVVIPETTARVNLKFEISPAFDMKSFNKPPPHLISIKEIFFTQKTMCFLINLNQLNCPNELRITILEMTIFFLNGDKIIITFNNSYKFSELEYRDAFYKEDYVQNYASREKVKTKITQEKIFKKIQTDFIKNTQETTYMYQRNQFENSGENVEYYALIQENNERLKRVEEELKNISNMLRQGRFSGNNYTVTNSLLEGPPQRGIERIKKTSKTTTITQQSIIYLGELKTVLKKGQKDNKEFDIREILKPMSEEDLNKITLNEEDLLKKQEEAINNEIERLKKQESQVLRLENLKKPE